MWFGFWFAVWLIVLLLVRTYVEQGGGDQGELGGRPGLDTSLDYLDIGEAAGVFQHVPCEDGGHSICARDKDLRRT